MESCILPLSDKNDMKFREMGQRTHAHFEGFLICTAVQKKRWGSTGCHLQALQGTARVPSGVLTYVASKLYAKALLTSIKIMCILGKQCIFLKNLYVRTDRWGLLVCRKLTLRKHSGTPEL